MCAVCGTDLSTILKWYEGLNFLTPESFRVGIKKKKILSENYLLVKKTKKLKGKKNTQVVGLNTLKNKKLRWVTKNIVHLAGSTKYEDINNK